MFDIRDRQLSHSKQTKENKMKKQDTYYVADIDMIIDTLESIYPPVEITDGLICSTAEWLEEIAANWDGSDIEGKTGGKVDRDAQGYIIDWSRALVEVEND